MQLRLIRNATLRLDYGGIRFLVDPYLALRHALPPYAEREPNPTVDLPLPAEEIVAAADAVLVSHLHDDHFDEAARDLLESTCPILCQPVDHERIAAWGFSGVRPVEDGFAFGGVSFERVPGRHGSDATAELMGPVSGFVLRSAGEPTLYLAGDTVLTDGVRAAVTRHRPEVIVVHASGASWKGSGPIVMDAAQTLEVLDLAPWAVVVAVHLDALDHGTVSRADLRAAAAGHLGRARLRVPEDGEAIAFGAG